MSGFEQDPGADWGESADPQQSNDPMIEVENMCVEAESMMETKIDEAIERFETACQMEQGIDNQYNFQFRATKFIIILLAKKGDEGKILPKLKSLLKLCPKVTQNEARDSLSFVLDQLTKHLKPQAMEALYEEMMTSLKSSNEKLWQSVCLRLCRIYLDKKKYAALAKLAIELKATLRGADGNFDEKKGSPFEILALEMQMSSEMKDTKRLKQLYGEANSFSGVVTDAKVNAMLKECGGLIFLSEKNWERAQEELLESFKSYQQLANPKAKYLLKLLLVTSMVGSSQINPMTLAEATAYQNHPEIGPIADLRKAYENNKITQLKQIMASKGKKLMEDPELKDYSGDFFKAIKQKILIEKIAAYTNVSLAFLARDLTIEVSEVKSLLVELILDERIDGKIDESLGILKLKGAERDNLENKRYLYLERMASNLESMYATIIQSIHSQGKAEY